MKRNPYLAALLSLIVPGLGQIYARKGKRGAVILIAVIIIGNLNAIWLSLYGMSHSSILSFWGNILPGILHDVFAFYGIIFWIVQVVDAYVIAKKAE